MIWAGFFLLKHIIHDLWIAEGKNQANSSVMMKHYPKSSYKYFNWLIHHQENDRV